MAEMPVFPLNTVLFPHAPLYLHIFEERYKRMIRLCIHENRPFGVVLIRRGQEAFGPPAEPYMVGCSATIVEVRNLERGRFNLTVIGGDRFRIRSLDTDSQSYLLADTVGYPWRSAGVEQAAAGAGDLSERVREYTELLTAGKSEPPHMLRLPQDPFAAACIAAAILQIEPVEKQALLELQNAAALIERVSQLYRRETAIIQAIHSHGERDSDQPFSVN